MRNGNEFALRRHRAAPLACKSVAHGQRQCYYV